MNTQDFSTVIEFIGNKTDDVVDAMTATTSATSAQTADSLLFIISALLIACIVGFVAYFLVRRKLAFNQSTTSPMHVSTFNSKLNKLDNKSSKFVLALIALVLCLCVSLMVLPSLRANAEPASDDEFPVAMTEKVEAQVDYNSGDITFGECKITNTGDKLSVGVRKIATQYTGDLAGTTLTVMSGNDTLYRSTIGDAQIQDDYFLVPNGSSADLTFALSVDAQKAKTLAGNASITMTTTIDLISCSTGRVLNADDNPAADVEVDYTYVDPYTEEVCSGNAKTDEDGIYIIDPVPVDTALVATFTAVDGASKTLKVTADNSEKIPDIKISDFAEIPVAKTGLVYNGSLQSGFSEVDNVTLENFTATNAGTYKAIATPNPGFYWRDMTKEAKEIEWQIAKATPTFTAPSAISGLVYDKSSQTIANTGTCSAGSMKYMINDTRPEKSASDWSDAIPTKTDAGNYSLWYYIAGDSNYNDIDVCESAVACKIDKATPTCIDIPDSTMYAGRNYEYLLSYTGDANYEDFMCSSTGPDKIYVSPSGDNVKLTIILSFYRSPPIRECKIVIPATNNYNEIRKNFKITWQRSFP